ncbi:PREDICTED: uncharacterized protein LOC109335835 isoform X3 [Lupinus angustifolius]|uniref:uncharacterized protein LOC109335835 isoform X2 n=1 Tax=Lupinus angustifolius TaxID=3871 RepID=UPI00092E688A|nr:PREDICTED: uncharacterized protein LOC109335835 isoform X2 [Lupinus angustifolius]XP_019427593.1 PREDICTED: uncharacterized protein LOC109335835 isoform X3 [Lupinus angustifolius]
MMLKKLMILKKSDPNILYRLTTFSRFNHTVNNTLTLLLPIPIKLYSLSPRPFFFNLTSNYRFYGTSYLSVGSILGLSVASTSVIAHSMDAGDAMVDHSYNDSHDISEEEEGEIVLNLWKLSTKVWLPLLFFLTIFTNLGDPIPMLFLKITLFLLTTNPNPFSVYVFVDKLCKQCMRQETQFLNAKSLYANKVEVQDYKFLCVADIEVRGQKFTLVGILGTWWTLPHLPSWEGFSFVRNRLLKHLSEKNEPGNLLF